MSELTLELWCLLGAVLMGLIHISVASFSFKAQVGNAYTVGPRDEPMERNLIAGRLQRAQTNFQETFPLFAALVLVAHLVGASGLWSQIGAVVYVSGRAIYLPLYAWGVPWLRTLSWNAASAGLVMVGVQVL